MTVSDGCDSEIFIYWRSHNKQLERKAKSLTRKSTEKPKSFNNSFTVIV